MRCGIVEAVRSCFECDSQFRLVGGARRWQWELLSCFKRECVFVVRARVRACVRAGAALSVHRGSSRWWGLSRSSRAADRARAPGTTISWSVTENSLKFGNRALSALRCSWQVTACSPWGNRFNLQCGSAGRILGLHSRRRLRTCRLSCLPRSFQMNVLRYLIIVLLLCLFFK